MLDEIVNAAKDNISQRMTSEEATAVKAQIVIKKGGTFADSSSQTSDPFGDMLAGLDLPGDLMEEFNQITSAVGIDNTGSFTGYKDNEIIKVQLNPNSYNIKSVTNFKSEKMGGVKVANGTFGVFGPPKPRELSVKLYYDTNLQADYLEKLKNAAQNIVKSVQSATSLMSAATSMMQVYKKFDGKEDLNKLYLDRLLGLTHILKDINTPALISFQYGSTVFEGYTKQVSVDYQRFNKEGEVIRAEVSLSIEESNMFADQQKESHAAAASPNLADTSKVLSSFELPL